jgi:hypothetical protein
LWSCELNFSMYLLLNFSDTEFWCGLQCNRNQFSHDRFFRRHSSRSWRTQWLWRCQKFRDLRQINFIIIQMKTGFVLDTILVNETRMISEIPLIC